MSRIGTVAVALGVVAGLWGAASVYLGLIGKGPNVCLVAVIIDCSEPAVQAQVVGVLGIALLFVSLLCFVGPKKLFYFSAILSVLMAGFLFAVPGDFILLALTLALFLGEFVLSLVAARTGPKMSEQSNPMNLPVFG